ncbi:uncharacterized protein LOC130786347 [Actinidia eriantha]|uniref:uncharacterized protein LOC130786347 n=1 Tax=Actinidia eriantha TaxID=165200 RepID=UPI002583BCD6|nr:uncharacterized protein LOC130786347 [Actinidia eriantha]
MAWECYPPSPHHTCDAWQADDSIIPIDAIPPDDSGPYFCIKIVTMFSTHTGSEDGELNTIESVVRVKTFMVPIEQLVDNNTSWLTISDMLTTVDIPISVQPNIIYRIDECLASMACAGRNAGVRVLPVIVSIHVQDYMEDEAEADHDEGADESDVLELVLRESMSENTVPQVPASVAAVEALETVVLEAGDLAIKECAICQEALALGSNEIKRMPCKHVFHGGCIVRWLGVSCFCPLCRFRLPTS